jgi:hypothetical protein
LAKTPTTMRIMAHSLLLPMARLREMLGLRRLKPPTHYNVAHYHSATNLSAQDHDVADL